MIKIGVMADESGQNTIRATSHPAKKVAIVSMHIQGEQKAWIEYDPRQLASLINMLTERLKEIR